MKIIDVKNITTLDNETEEICVKTSKKKRKILRYCDCFDDSKSTTIYRNLQSYDDTELNTINGWWEKNRTPKNDSYVFEMRSNRFCFWFRYCFVEDTRPFTNEEKMAKRNYIKTKMAKIKREQGPWLTSWQLLKYDKRKVKDDAKPRKRYNTLYDAANDEFYEADKAFYYYNWYDTEEVDEAEFQRLKELYIKKYGGWEKIDLEHTEYNGLKWY